MHQLIIECDGLLKDQGFDYAFCGGHALDIHIGRVTRLHGDIDLSVWWEDRERIITFMQAQSWTVYEAMGGGMIRLLTGASEPERRNLFCVRDDCPFFHVKPLGEDIYHLRFRHTEQKYLNYIEFLFNMRSGTEFIYGHNETIHLALSRAILRRDGIAYFAPELALLYKSADLKRKENRRDFDAALPHLSSEGRLWLKSVLPEGHKWIAKLEEHHV